MNSSFVATFYFHMSCTGLSYKSHLEKDTFANNDYKGKQKKKEKKKEVVCLMTCCPVALLFLRTGLALSLALALDGLCRC